MTQERRVALATGAAGKTGSATCFPAEEGHQVVVTYRSSERQAQADSTLLGRFTTLDEIAAAVDVAAALLTFSTGCVIFVDSGRPLRHRQQNRRQGYY